MPRGMTIACATPTSGLVLWSEGWADIDEDETISRAEVTVSIARAIESPANCEATDTVVRGLSLMLGKAGMKAANNDAKRIVASGRLPLLVLLVEADRPKAVMFATMMELLPRNGRCISATSTFSQCEIGQSRSESA